MATTVAMIGLSLAVAVAVFARVVGFDRERVFYPVVLIVVASYYVLFATMGGERAELITQLAVFGLFATVAVVSFRTNIWVAVAGLAMHGVYDCLYQSFAGGHGVPQWWPSFCGAYDLAAAAALAILLIVDKPHQPEGDIRRLSRSA